MNDSESGGKYAHLPEDLIKQILDAVPATVDKMNGMFDTQDEPIRDGIQSLRDHNLVRKLPEGDSTDSLIAVDGGNIVERMSGTDILLAVAVGVEGLLEGKSIGWEENRNQYYQWQTVLPHEEATPRLCQGAMFLMELSVLVGSRHEIRIMDGSHFSPIIKINSMLSAKEDSAGPTYVGALREFLRNTYEKIIPDIPDIISSAMSDEHVVAFTKYSSSRDILDEYLDDKRVSLDDKTFFTLGLEEGEYTDPMSVGQSAEERRKIWNDLHIKCNLELKESEEDLNDWLKDAIAPLRTKDADTKEAKKSELFFTYYKPHGGGPACRIECKKKLATDKPKFERMLRSIKAQISYPDIREPFPQYLADLMAKSVSGGLEALQEAIRLSNDLKIEGSKFDLLLPYRSR